MGLGAELVLLPVVVVVGTVEDGLTDGAEPRIEEIRAQARRAQLDLLAGVQDG